jgi:hypothetical protein
MSFDEADCLHISCIYHQQVVSEMYWIIVVKFKTTFLSVLYTKCVYKWLICTRPFACVVCIIGLTT